MWALHTEYWLLQLPRLAHWLLTLQVMRVKSLCPHTQKTQSPESQKPFSSCIFLNDFIEIVHTNIFQNRGVTCWVINKHLQFTIIAIVSIDRDLITVSYFNPQSFNTRSG